MADLPVRAALPQLREALDGRGVAVLEAPPGAGKTTLVPLALLDAPWRGDGRIVVTEPRRLAARAAARRMAQLLDEGLGATVGYVTRDERVTSKATRIEVVTEGVLLRRIQRDPSLAGIAAVIVDEFHERSLEADLALAFTVETHEALRPDLRIVVMSATLEGERVARLLDDAPRVVSEGRLFPVETHHLTRTDPRRIAQGSSVGLPPSGLLETVVAAIERALGETEGDVLVFLPGAREIRRVARDLTETTARPVARDILIAPLYGALPPREQDRALDPAPRSMRKIVLATDIAETSLTIEGVRVVVDSGLAREPRLDPRTGMSRLETVRVSRASADQRRGRAGRTAPGTCYRLWPERETAGLDPFRRPAITQIDLAGFVLEVARWGADPTDPASLSQLRLLDAPPAPAHAQAVTLLEDLGCLEDGRLTDHGRAVAELPAHPRLGHLLVRGNELGRGALAADLAAILGDRDPLNVERFASHVDIGARVDALRGRPAPPRTTPRRGTLRAVRREAERLRRAVGASPDRPDDPTHVGALLSLAYPDRIARNRGRRGAFVLANGRGATVAEDDVLAGEDLLVVADADAGGSDARIYLAAGVDLADLRRVHGDRIRTLEVVAWDSEVGDVVAERQERLGAAVLTRTRLDRPPEGDTTAALLDAIRDRGSGVLPWTREAQEFRHRVGFLRRELAEDWPDLSDEALLATLESWLAPFLTRARRVAHLDRVPLLDALRAQVPPGDLPAIDRLAPTHLQVPSGSHVRLDYSAERPVLAVKLQELFSSTATPRIAGGRVPVLLHLLSPAQRPVQVTDDLAGFWERSYPEIRKELRGRYPKHPWPEDPLTATPTRRTKRRGT
ncbi:MAG: ATP-dependent helicase HrpB [Actinobacteria bacterium]|nr:ATP-dependent helicase HrpB [Actinomycetota bacterium]